MTKPLVTVERVFRLRAEGYNISQIARATGVTRSTIREWLQQPAGFFANRHRTDNHEPAQCDLVLAAPWPAYSYLLGQYLGDGCISEIGPRGVFRLRLATCDDYPGIRRRCVEAVAAVLPDHRIGFFQSIGCGEVSAYSKHWPCLFPQHGPGRKHERLIVLERWQQEIVLAEPQQFLAGLIHSDGCRCINNVTVRGKAYSYPRYFFNNTSKDILMLCAWAFDLLGVEWKQNNWNSLSVAKRDSVALLDTFIGPKS